MNQCWCHHSHYCGIGLPANYHHQLQETLHISLLFATTGPDTESASPSHINYWISLVQFFVDRSNSKWDVYSFKISHGNLGPILIPLACNLISGLPHQAAHTVFTVRHCKLLHAPFPQFAPLFLHPTLQVPHKCGIHPWGTLYTHGVPVCLETVQSCNLQSLF